jgi:diguanylate cyclase (GGDEF)-like protein/PAS domain S-box-containing protein
LGDATLEIAKGNLNHHIELRTRDEVSDLAQSFNQMTESLKSSRNAAEAYVKERLETNRKLKDEIVVRNMAEASLIKTQEQLQHLLSSTPAAIYRKAVPEMALSYISDNVQKLTGYAVAAFMNDTNFWIDHIHSEDAPKVLSSYKSIYHTDSNRTEYRFLNNDGSYIWLLDESYLKRDGEGNASDIFGYCIDITERKKLEEQLQYDAMHDPLTDLPNRSLFIDRLNVCLARMHRHPDYLFAVLFLDLDRFKNINDSLGHVAGDKLLKATARKLERCVRLDDSLSRLGGDEFAIILNDMEDASDAIMIAERILIELNTPFILDKHEVFITTSIGITIGKQEYQATEQIIRDSDTAMYVAKTKGGKCYKVFDQSMHVRAVARLHMEMDLRKAVEQQLFTLHYQPIVSAVSEKIVGFEALLRYEHRTKGLISPMEFIPIAEETGLILPIGKWVLRQACETLFSWQKKYPSEKPLTMSINVSSKQLNDEFIDDVKAVLLETGLNPEHLILEITETILMQDINFINQFLAQLKAVKVKLHVDDFGTGYSSLSYLQSFPIDALKIDRSFIKNIDLYREKYNIVKTISSLAQNLNLEMVAEGVETVHQLTEVMKLKCNYIQGYLFSKPLAALEAEKLLQKPNPVQSMRI